MLTAQPFLIGGIEDEEVAKSSAFGAMSCFAVTFVMSVVGICYDRNNEVEDIKENGEAEYHLAKDQMTSYGTH